MLDLQEKLKRLSETRNTILELFDGWNIKEVESMLNDILDEVRRRSIYHSR